jgi:type IX secretion system PorP/SprF family membrane protein
MMYRKQWVNFEGSPRTSIVSVDGPFADNKMGLGLIISNDKIGATVQNDILANYAYHLKLGEGKLAFGLKAGISQYRMNHSELVIWDTDDQTFFGDMRTMLVPRFGFGTFYYSERFYAGLSVPTMIAYQRDRSFNLDLNQSSELRRHFFLTTGYVFDINESIKLRPSTLVKYVPAAPVQVDLNCSALFYDVFWFGLSYRTNDAVVALVEYQTNNRFRIGYSFDFTTTAIRRFSNGSHELMIGYDFGRNAPKDRTPRFF